MIEVEDMVLVPGRPAVYNKVSQTLVIADLHLGYEDEVAQQGIFLPQVQLKKAINMIIELQELTKAKILVINGDIKNSFNKLTMKEREEIIRFFGKAKEIFDEVILVRGNHDNYVPIITEKMEIPVVNFYKISEKSVAIHGHEIIEEVLKYSLIIIGHEHPAVVLKDELGSLMKIPVFLKVPLKNEKKLLVLPAAGYYQSGNPVTLDIRNYLSPIVREFGLIEQAVPILVDQEGKDLIEFPTLVSLQKLFRM